MKSYFVFAVAFCSIVGSSSGKDCRESVIRLDFGAVRSGSQPSSIGPTPAFPSPPPALCSPPGEPNTVVCSEARYPDDIFCNVGGLEGHSSWNNDTTGVWMVELKYEHPSAEGTFCLVTFYAEREGAKNLPFSEAECSTAVEDEEVPYFAVAKVIQMKIIPKPLQVHLGLLPCYRRIYRMGGAKRKSVAKGGAREEPEIYTFQLENFACPTFWGNIVTGRRPNKAYFSHNGRRYRPIK